MSVDWYRKRLNPGGHAGYRAPAPQVPAARQAQQAVIGEAPMGQIHAVDGVRSWNGTRDGQRTSSGCPQCGSGNYFPEMRASSLGGGESGRVSLGHCFNCSYRPDGRGAPSLQERGMIRPMNADGSGSVPIVPARMRPVEPFRGFQLVGRV